MSQVLVILTIIDQMVSIKAPYDFLSTGSIRFSMYFWKTIPSRKQHETVVFLNEYVTQLSLLWQQ